jgi:uncharacterized protein with von Willebrand factor type A (vWA) domain
MDETDIATLIRSIDKLNDTVERRNTGASIGNSVINFNASGVVVWISLSCVAVLIVMNLMQGATITKLETKYDRMQDYLNAIYAQAPHLKPKEISQ